VTEEQRYKIDEKTEIIISRIPQQTTGCLLVIIVGLALAAATAAMAMF
jgi:hypothetical protein